MLIPSNYWQTDDAFPGLRHGSESLVWDNEKIPIHRMKNPEPVPPLNTAVHMQQMAKQEYTCSVLLWQLSPKGPTAAADVSLWRCCAKPQQIKAAVSTAATCWAQYSPIILQVSARTPTSHSWFELIFLCFSLGGTSCKTWRTFPQDKNNRGIKHGVFNISLDFCTTHQSYKDSEFWGALKTMPRRIWKGSARNVSSGGFSAKKYKGHWVKVSWEACKQENLPIKGTPSEHNVLSDCFIRKSIYNCFLLLWTENDRGAKALNQGEEGKVRQLSFTKTLNIFYFCILEKSRLLFSFPESVFCFAVLIFKENSFLLSTVKITLCQSPSALEQSGLFQQYFQGQVSSEMPKTANLE